MQVSSSVNAGYYNSYENRIESTLPPGYESRNVRRNTGSNSFAEEMNHVAQAGGSSSALVLHGADEESGDTLVSAWADNVDDFSVSVYKPTDFDAANPVYKVKVWDRAGNVTEQMIEVSKVNPENCNTIEMYAYTAYLDDTGEFEGALRKFISAKAQARTEQQNAGDYSLTEKIDWMEIIRRITQSQYDTNNLKGYMEWKKFLDFLED